MPWYVEKATGRLQKAATAPGSGWMLIAGSTDAMTRQQAADKLVQDALHSNPGFNVLPGLEKAAGAAGSAAAGLVPGLSSVEGFLARLTEASTWLRVAEAVLGIVLIAVGLARLTRAVPVATQIAKAVT